MTIGTEGKPPLSFLTVTPKPETWQMARVAVEFPSLCSIHYTPIPRRGKAPRRGRVHEHASPALASRLGRGRTLRELEITVCLSEAFQKSLRQRTLVSHPDLVVPTT